MPLTLYAIQLTLSTLWTPLFFNGHKVKLALLDAIGKSNFVLLEFVILCFSFGGRLDGNNLSLF